MADDALSAARSPARPDPGAALAPVGVLMLALNGMGDALDAIDAYQLEPTAENLAKMREQLDALGPAGADFARYLDDLEPQLQSLQDAAREGFFPGAEASLDHLLSLLPQASSAHLLSRVVAGGFAVQGLGLGGETGEIGSCAAEGREAGEPVGLAVVDRPRTASGKGLPALAHLDPALGHPMTPRGRVAPARTTEDRDVTGREWASVESGHTLSDPDLQAGTERQAARDAADRGDLRLGLRGAGLSARAHSAILHPRAVSDFGVRPSASEA